MTYEDMARLGCFEIEIQRLPYDHELRLVYADFLEEQGFDDKAEEQRSLAKFVEPITEEDVIKAKKFLDDYAEGIGVTLAELIDGAKEFAKGDWDYMYMPNRGDYPPDYASDSNQDEFWRAFEIFTCKPLPRDHSRSSFVTCNC